MLIPPREPQQEPIRLPLIYVEKQMKWEYKQVIRDLEQLLEEAELNALGEEGWEMTGIAQQPLKTYYYFKRQVEN
jgi:hypothetical protein